ncbi:hypothetical protein BGZ98_002612 [Dissophora globulifera]|nr:hypothetical protein BGZ98_002612 [Dissophora globulifera]
MTRPTETNVPASPEMTAKGKSVFAGLQNAAKRALRPSSFKDRTVYNALANVQVEQSRVTNRLGRFGEKQQPATPCSNQAQGVSGAYMAESSSNVIVHEAPIPTQPSNDQSVINIGDRTGSAGPSAAMEKDLPIVSGVDQVRAAIFPHNVGRPVIRTPLPKKGERIDKTPQLFFCLTLLAKDVLSSPSDLKTSLVPLTLDKDERTWIEAIEQEPVEQHHIHWLATRLVEEFIKDDVKSSTSITEIIYVSPMLDREHFRKLLCCFIAEFEAERLLNTDLLLGLVQLTQCAQPGYLLEDDLIKILAILRVRLQDTHQQSTEHPYHLTLALSRVLDVMAKHEVKDVDRVEQHEPLAAVLSSLRDNSDPFLMYQASYAFQALQCIPDDETVLQAVMRHSGVIAEGLINISGVINLNLSGFLEGLRQVQETTVATIEITKNVYKGVRSLIESGQHVFEAIKEGVSSGNKRAWYPAIIGAYALVLEGRLADFKVLVFEAACRRSPEFQWGICQMLGEIALDHIWDDTTRQQAVAFLVELYTNDPDWGQDASVKAWILTILDLASYNTDETITGSSAFLKQYTDKAGTAKFSKSYPLRSRLPPPAASHLLARVQEIPYIEYELHKLRAQRLQEYSQAVYIPPQAKASLQASNKDTLPLMEKVTNFLDSEQQVFLVLGDSGAGKSTFSRHLEHELWKKYEKDGRIPLFINLPAINEPYQDMIDKQLRIHNFSNEAIKEMKEHRQIILICDGYDETQSRINLHTANMLNRKGQADTKMVISCRTTHLGQDYRDQFQPQRSDRYSATAANLYTEAVIVPFSSDQIEDYVDQLVRDPEAHKLLSDNPQWSTEDYMNKLKSIPNLMELVKNPFLLTLSLRALPGVVKDAADLANIKVTRLTLYDLFIDQWLEINKLRLKTIKLSAEAESALQDLLEEGFTPTAIDFLKDLATAIFREQDGNPVVQYTPRSDKGTWKVKFFGPSPDITLLRESSPLSRAGIQHRFMHRSLLEYFYSRQAHETSKIKIVSDVSHDLMDHPLSQRNLVKEPSIVQFLAEHVQEDSAFKQRLYQIIERSKTDANASQAAANAITILVRAGISFIGADLKGIQISGADLSDGQFDSAQMQGADLRSVNLRNIWLRRADLSNAQMAGVQFGELPYLDEEDVMESCAYSPNGATLAVGLWNGNISFYNTLTWEKTRVLYGHDNAITSIAFSPNGQQIASGSYDTTVRLWDTQTGAPGAILSGHTDDVTSVVFSPSGQHVASGSRDMTVRLWDTETGVLSAILSGHTGDVKSVVFSPSGQHVASGSEDKTVRLWDTQTGAPDAILSGHTRGVESVVFSPSGQHVASASEDSTVRLWDTETGALGVILNGHTREVTTVVFSPSGQYIASGSNDKTVRLWDAQTGLPGGILSGHTDYVTNVVFSPSGQQIASGSQDRTVRLWDVQSGVPANILSGHARQVKSVAFSPNGQYIASGSEDKTVRVWDAQTGAPGVILSGHTDYVMSVAFSPSGQQIASGSYDGTVRLWDTETGVPGVILSGHTDGVKSAVFSPSGQMIASGSKDSTVRLWDAQTGAPGAILSGHTSHVLSVVFSPSGQQIASGSADKTIRLWDVQKSALNSVLRGHFSHVTSVVFSPNGQQIASGSLDNTVRIWDARTGVATAIISGHAWAVTCIVFSPGGQQIASGSWDETVRLWDAKSGQCLAVIKDVHGSARTIDFISTIKVERPDILYSLLQPPLSPPLSSFQTNPNQSMTQTQFHHYIPRFILKTFADNFSLDKTEFIMDISSPHLSGFKREKPSKLRRKGRPRYNINVYQVEDHTTDLADVSRAYGVNDMYRDVTEDDCMKFEKLLAKHESTSATFIREIWNEEDDLSLTRTRLGSMKKFLVVMMYRSEPRRSQYFNLAFDFPTEISLKKHMDYNNFSNAQSVWFENLKWVIETSVEDILKEYQKVIVARAESKRPAALLSPYQGPIHAIELQDFGYLMTQTIACIWQAEAGSEFILSERCFGTFEGYTGIWIHNFFIVSPRFAIVLVNKVYMNQRIEKISLLNSSFGDKLHVFPETDYKNGPPSKDFDLMTHFTPDDVFTYKRIVVPKEDVFRVNAIVLDSRRQFLTYKSNVSMYKSLRYYDKIKKEEKGMFPDSHDYSILKRKVFSDLNRTHPADQ